MQSVSFKAKHVVITKRPSKLRKLYAALVDVLGFLPSFRDTRSGRQHMKAWRIGFMIAGLIVFALLDDDRRLWGIPLATLALFLPLTEMQKRTIITKLRLRMEVSEEVEKEVDVVWDGRRLDVLSPEKIRSILTKPGRFHSSTVDGFKIWNTTKKVETVIFADEPGIDVFAASPDDVQRLQTALRELS
jgi:hypothetical protein